MRKWILSTILTSVAGYAWKNRHRVFGSSRDDEADRIRSGA